MTLKQLIEKYLSNYEGGFSHLNALRWLYKREPELWQDVLEITLFLDNTAKPKQRIWHILNDVYSTPLCPVDNIPTKWCENRYLKYSSRSAKARDPEHTKLRMETYQKKTGERHWYAKENPNRGKQLEKQKQRDYSAYESALKRPEIREQIKETLIKKYGVINPGQLEHVKELNRNHNKSEQEKYNDKVAEYTKESWIKHFDDINPDRIKRGPKWHLDHIYSRYQGFHDNIPPEIIGHYTNLQMLSCSDNSGKRHHCHKTKEELLEDYNAAK